jgi:hypothetical protein
VATGIGTKWCAVPVTYTPLLGWWFTTQILFVTHQNQSQIFLSVL